MSGLVFVNMLMFRNVCNCVWFVAGRTRVIPFNHKVLLPRGSWSSSSVWHHKVGSATCAQL